jgi:hypothetical protein
VEDDVAALRHRVQYGVRIEQWRFDRFGASQRTYVRAGAMWSDDANAPREQRLDEVAPEEPGPARDERDGDHRR